MSHRPLADERWYSTPALLRSLQTYPAGVTDDNLRQWIDFLSQQIDRITGQSFWPLIETFVQRGRLGYDVFHPRSLPILDVTLVEENFGREVSPYYPADPAVVANATWSTVSDAIWEQRERSIFLTSRFFGQGFLNLRVTGVFGWLANVRYASALTTVDVETDDTTVTVDDASGFRRRDVIDLAGPVGTTPLRAIIESITGNVLTIDAATDTVDVPAGSTVYTWGQVPLGIERVLAGWIYNRALMSLGSPALAAGRLKKEVTDSYSYELHAPSDSAYTGELTGDPLLDATLDSFTAPMYAGVI